MSAALALNDAEFNALYKTKALAKAADYFGDHAKRRMPQPPDTWAAEMLAAVLGSLIGKPEPEPLPDLPLVGDMKKPARVGGKIEELPEATQLLLAKGRRRVAGNVAVVYSAFLRFPDAEWSARELVDRIPGSNVGAVLQNLRNLAIDGVIVRVKKGRYKLAPGI